MLKVWSKHKSKMLVDMNARDRNWHINTGQKVSLLQKIGVVTCTSLCRLSRQHVIENWFSFVSFDFSAGDSFNQWTVPVIKHLQIITVLFPSVFYAATGCFKSANILEKTLLQYCSLFFVYIKVIQCRLYKVGLISPVYWYCVNMKHNYSFVKLGCCVLTSVQAIRSP